jgi:hypothetical protein
MRVHLKFWVQYINDRKMLKHSLLVDFKRKRENLRIGGDNFYDE